MTRKPRVFELYDVYSEAKERKRCSEIGDGFVEGDLLFWRQGLRFLVWPLPVQTEAFVPLSLTIKHANALEHFSKLLKKPYVRIRMSSHDAGLLTLFQWRLENWEYVDVCYEPITKSGFEVMLTVKLATDFYIKRLIVFEDEHWYFRCQSYFGKKFQREFERRIGRTCGVVLSCSNDDRAKLMNLTLESEEMNQPIRCDVIFIQQFRYSVPNGHKVYVFDLEECAMEEMHKYVQTSNAKFFASTKAGNCFKCDTNVTETKIDIIPLCSKSASKWAHHLIVDYSIAFRNIFPPYVLLEILDWLPDVEREEHTKKIATIYSVKQSIEKIFLNKFATDS